jgi:hypothetical protein
MSKQAMLYWLAFLTVFNVCAFSARADEQGAHTDETAPDLGWIRVVDGDRTVSITLEDAFAYHEHPCPGATVAFRAVQYGVRLLWGDATPAREDIVIFSRGPMYGVLDVFALVTKGPIRPKADAISQPSPVLSEMRISRDSFVFTMIRRSTGEAVDLRVVGALYPDDFFALRKKAKQDTASPDERQQLKQYQRRLIGAIPKLKESELFEAPVRYRVLMFGA